jgi:hypothetical protein
MFTSIRNDFFFAFFGTYGGSIGLLMRKMKKIGNSVFPRK